VCLVNATFWFVLLLRQIDSIVLGFNIQDGTGMPFQGKEEYIFIFMYAFSFNCFILF